MRARPGDLLAGLAGLALLVTTFLTWYASGGTQSSAWEALSVTVVLAALTGGIGVALLLVQIAQRVPAIPVALSVVATAIAVPVTLLIAYRIVNPPGANDAVDVRLGAFLALAACASTALGAFLSMRDEAPRAEPRAVPVQQMPPPPVTIPGSHAADELG